MRHFILIIFILTLHMSSHAQMTCSNLLRDYIPTEPEVSLVLKDIQNQLPLQELRTLQLLTSMETFYTEGHKTDQGQLQLLEGLKPMMSETLFKLSPRSMTELENIQMNIYISALNYIRNYSGRAYKKFNSNSALNKENELRALLLKEGALSIELRTEPYDTISDTALSDDSSAFSYESKSEAERVLGQFDDFDRSVIELYLLQRRSLDDVSKTLGRTRERIRQRTTIIIRRLQRIVEDDNPGFTIDWSQRDHDY